MVNKILKKTLIFGAVSLGLFLSAAVVALVLFRNGAVSELSVFVKSVIAGAVVAGLYIPVMAWLYFRPASLDQYSGFPLEEMELDERELSEAVSNWVYIVRRRRMEGEPQFLEDDDGNVRCRVTVRKD